MLADIQKAVVTNNDVYRPIIRALALLKKHSDSKAQNYPLDEDVPLDGIVRGPWEDAIYDEDKMGTRRINRVTYEICVLQALRERLRCKEIWVIGANRYRLSTYPGRHTGIPRQR